MTSLKLKKYVEEQLGYKGEDLLENIVHNYAFNDEGPIELSSSASHNLFYPVIQGAQVNSSSSARASVALSNVDYFSYMIKCLPFYSRKDPLIQEIFHTVDKEFDVLRFENEERLKDYTISTSIKRLWLHEKDYGVKTNYSFGPTLRQNKLTARKLIRRSTFNKAYIEKCAELFQVGGVTSVVNADKTITVTLAEPLGGIETLEEFKKHLEEFKPAFYWLDIAN